jgi:hypothetical protein
MGSAPLPDLPPPPPATASGVSASAGFEPGPVAASLCGFKLPFGRFKFGFKIPGIDFPPKLPFPYVAFGINCNLSNPIDMSVGLKYGGGRQPNHGVDPDLDDQTP